MACTSCAERARRLQEKLAQAQKDYYVIVADGKEIKSFQIGEGDEAKDKALAFYKDSLASNKFTEIKILQQKR